MRRMLIVLAVLAGCSNEQATTGPQAQPDTPKARSAKPPSLTKLVGLYEGSSSPTDQMCVVARAGGYSFGLVVWGGNNHSCSGSGTISRNGDRVELVMAGDSACTLTGSITGDTIRLGDDQPRGCAYYCGARARLAGAALTQEGATLADALKAKDLVGEPLCAAS